MSEEGAYELSRGSECGSLAVRRLAVTSDDVSDCGDRSDGRDGTTVISEAASMHGSSDLFQIITAQVSSAQLQQLIVPTSK